MSYFSFNGDRFRFHKNVEPAISQCNKAIEGYKSNDGYDEEVVNVCWGVVVQRAETEDPNADYRTHEYNLRDTGAVLPEMPEDREQEAREKRYWDRLKAIANSVWELDGAEDPNEILTAIERGIQRLKPCSRCQGTGWEDSGYGERYRCGCK